MPPVQPDTPDPLAIHDAHQRGFERITARLEASYRGYANGDKIIALLSYWLYGCRCILACHGLDAAKEFCRGGIGSHVRFAYLYEYGVDINIQPSTLTAGSLFPIAAGLIDIAYLPGGRVCTIHSKLMWRITKFVTLNAPIAVRQSREQALINTLADYFQDGDASFAEECLHSALPAVFVADQINVPLARRLRVDCSALSFMEFCGYEHLLLFDRPLHVIGRQHGGGYDMFAVDYLVDFEKQLCDQFIGWGMSSINERQHKYRLFDPPKSFNHRGEKRLIWVERARLPLVMAQMSPALYGQATNKRVMEYVYNEFRVIERTFFNLVYPGELRSEDYAGKRGEELTGGGGKGETLIHANDVVVFDISGASLIHYCIEHDIVFVLVLCRDEVHRLTEGSREWLQLLRRFGLAFFDDEAGRLSRGLGGMLSSKYELPAEVKAYNKERFKDI